MDFHNSFIHNNPKFGSNLKPNTHQLGKCISNLLYTHMQESNSVIKGIKSAIFSLLSATTVTYSQHSWLLMPKEVINKPPEWLLKTRTLEKFLWTQNISVRPWQVATVDWALSVCPLFSICLPWLWQCPLLSHTPKLWLSKKQGTDVSQTRNDFPYP